VNRAAGGTFFAVLKTFLRPESDKDEVAALDGDRTHGRDAHWTVEEAEDLLRRLEGVISARIIVDARGQVDEIHLVTTRDVPPKKTVRNVESALMAHYDLSVDHRKVSVAQTYRPAPRGEARPGHPSEPEHTPPPARPPVNRGIIESPWGDPQRDARRGPRLVFVRHRQDRSRSKRLRMTVELEWGGESYEGNAETLDLPRQRLEATAEATLSAVRSALEAAEAPISLDLDGVEVVQALDHHYALVSVHGIVEGRFSPLTGVVSVAGDPEQAVILATLRATERPVRIILGETGEVEEAPGADEEAAPPPGDPLRLWGGGS
jgi:hypothetical protein